LGATLFSLFINDDVKLYCFFDNFSYDLQIVCDKLTEWADKWQMKIAFNKCAVHRISNRDSHINQNPGYTIGGQILDQSNETRDLGNIITIRYDTIVCI